MALTLKISAVAITVAVASAANASVVEAAASCGMSPSFWIVMISMLALGGLAAGGPRRSAAPADDARPDVGLAHRPAAQAASAMLRAKPGSGKGAAAEA